MKGIKFLTNEKNERIAVQIEISSLEKYRDEIEDLLDVIIAESRNVDEEISWNSVKAKLNVRR